MNFYFENLTVSSFLFIFRNKYLKDISKESDHIIYYVDASKIGIICGQIFGKIFGVEFRQLKFKMIDIKDENGELVRLRIPRIDLFEIQNKIIQSIEYHQLYHPKWKLNRLEEFLKKGIIDGSNRDNLSCSRILYLINIIHWHQEKKITTKSKLIINRRPWFKILKGYASNLDVELIETYHIPKLDIINKVIQLLKESPYLYIFFRNLKQRKYNSKIKPPLSKRPKLYLEGRGDVNIENNGHHSDFFWQMNSDFDANNLLYDAQTDEESSLLRKKKICVSDKAVKFYKKDRTNFTCSSSDFTEERQVIQKQLSSYNLSINYWDSFFKMYSGPHK